MSNSEIEALANKCIMDYNPEHKVPFPVYEVERHHEDLQVAFGELNDENVSGFIFFKDGKFRIFVNSAKHQNRINFTLAHELGHYFLHRNLIVDQDLVDVDDTIDHVHMLYRMDDAKELANIEREANRFAAYLLMPKDLLFQVWKAVGEDVVKCAKIFGVSTAAMSIRLEEMGLAP